MRTAMETSSSFPNRHFKWIMRKDGGCSGGGDITTKQAKEEKEEEEIIFSFSSSSSSSSLSSVTAVSPAKKKIPPAGATAVSRFRSAVTGTIVSVRRHGRPNSTRSHIIMGTMYGHRSGHVHLAFQVDLKSPPVVLLELAMPTSNLVKEMASGLVRIALECASEICDVLKAKEPKRKQLLEESPWLAYCNGRKCGYAVRRECGPADWKVLEAVGPVSMGAGVLPRGGSREEEEERDSYGEVMYMRAKFKRVVGCRDSEAFYMMSPDGKGGTDLSIFFLRV